MKEKISNIDLDIYRHNQQRNLLQEKINLTEQHIKELHESNDQLIEEKTKLLQESQDQINDIKNKIELCNKEILLLSEKTTHFGSLQKKMSDITKLNHQLQHKVQLLNKEINFFQDNTNCPTCNQEIEEEFKLLSVSSKNKEQLDISDAINKIAERINDTQSQIDEVSNIQKEINQNTLKVKELQNNIMFHENNQRNFNKEIKQLQEKKEEIDTSQLVEWKDELKQVRQVLHDSSDDRLIMGTAATLLKDNGIKAKIIKTYVPIINQLIQKYLAALDFFIEFKLDEKFSETINSRYRDTFKFESFSQGEKARIDLALLFTFRALAKLRGSVDCNLVIFDECFDGALDFDGVENLLKLINNLTNNENVIIISHREGISEDKFDRVLKFSKIKNFSHVNR